MLAERSSYRWRWQRETLDLALSQAPTRSRSRRAGTPIRARRIGIVAANHRPDRSRLIRATRRVLAVQVVAAVVAITLGVPDLIDRLTGPSSCTFCYDLRGVDFILLLIVFGPVVLALTAAASLLRQGRMWPSWLALAVNLVVVGSIPLTVLPLITGWGATCSDMCDSFGPSHVPLLVQHIQGVLLAVPPLASLVLVVLLLGLPLIRPSRPRSTAPGT
jgi:hypothetical protein